MDSSHGFGSHRRHRASFRLGSPLAPLLYRRLTCDDDALAGSFYKRHAISPYSPSARVASDCWCVRGFRVSFIPLSGCFSPFPHGTCSLSVAKRIEPWRVVPPASHKISRVSWYSGSQRPVAALPLRDSHPLRWVVPDPSSRSLTGHLLVLQPHLFGTNTWFGLLPVRSPLLGESRLISSRRATEMFQFARCPPPHL